jgi:hypothetical protein
MRYGAWNVRRLYRSSSLTTAARELAKYKLDIMGVHDVRWDIRCNATAADFVFFSFFLSFFLSFFYGKGDENYVRKF